MDTPQAPDPGHHGRTVAAKYSPYCVKACVVSILSNMIPNIRQGRGKAVVT